MSQNPLISIIIPVYNVENFLGHCLESIISQTYTNLEIILIDDGSKDKSGLICDEYKKRDSRIIVYHKKNEGASATRNLGLSIFKGDYVCFIDSDDYVTNNFIESLYKLLIENDADFSVCSRYIVSNNVILKKELLNDCILTGNYIYDFILFRNSSSNKLFKKSAVIDCQFPTNIIQYEDAFFIRYLCLKVKRIVITSNVYYFYQVNPNSITHTGNCSYYEIIKLLELHQDYLLMCIKNLSEKQVIEDSFSLYIYWFNNMIMHKQFSTINESTNQYYKTLFFILKHCKKYKKYIYYKIRKHKIYFLLRRIKHLFRCKNIYVQ